MKSIKFICMLVFGILAASCSKNNEQPENNDGTKDLALVKTVTSGAHTLEIFSGEKNLHVGFNKVYLRLKDAGGKYISNVSYSWQPVMYMTGMQHSCPYSAITKKTGTDALYEGFIVFQMAGSDTEYWELSVKYMLNNVEYNIKERIAVAQAAKRNLEVFNGTDGSRYVLALVDPATPKVAVNDMSALLFKMENMMSFPSVQGYTLKIDPRMPGMGNHSSPNNVELKQSGQNIYYWGKLSLTMTGYWKINLQLLNPSGEVLKGEQVTSTNETSSIYFEVEF